MFVCVCSSNGLHTYTHFVMRLVEAFRILTKGGDSRHGRACTAMHCKGIACLMR